MGRFMRVHAYVDGFNLYYGARRTCGRSTPGWRWLDIRALIGSIIQTQGAWTEARLERVTYCTARIDGRTNLSGHRDQDVYLKALLASGSVDWIEYGNYVVRTKKALLATETANGKHEIHTSRWPVMIKNAQGDDVPDARFMVSYLHHEEKGSDVNLASHMLVDVLSGSTDAVIIVSNDSDLAFPVKTARERVPVGLVNPGQGPFAGDLMGDKAEGVGDHWWWRIEANTYRKHQLPDPVGSFTRPPGW